MPARSSSGCSAAVGPRAANVFMNLSRRTLYTLGGIAIVVFLCGNEGARRLIRRYFETHTLRNELVLLKRDNVLLQKEVYLLERDTTYIERIARKELGLVSKDEVEYRFKK